MADDRMKSGAKPLSATEMGHLQRLTDGKDSSSHLWPREKDFSFRYGVTPEHPLP